jgi:hypothetical protein
VGSWSERIKPFVYISEHIALASSSPRASRRTCSLKYSRRECVCFQRMRPVLYTRKSLNNFFCTIQKHINRRHQHMVMWPELHVNLMTRAVRNNKDPEETVCLLACYCT